MSRRRLTLIPGARALARAGWERLKQSFLAHNPWFAVVGSALILVLLVFFKSETPGDVFTISLGVFGFSGVIVALILPAAAIIRESLLEVRDFWVKFAITNDLPDANPEKRERASIGYRRVQDVSRRVNDAWQGSRYVVISAFLSVVALTSPRLPLAGVQRSLRYWEPLARILDPSRPDLDLDYLLVSGAIGTLLVGVLLFLPFAEWAYDFLVTEGTLDSLKGQITDPTPRGALGLCATVRGELYAVGGYNSQGYLDAVEVYRPADSIWTWGPSLPEPRCDVGLAVVGNRLYAIGGFRDGQFLDTVEVFDPRAKERNWSAVPAMLTARSDFGLATWGGKIYALGGYSNGKYLNVVEEFDPARGRWQRLPGLTEARSGLGAVALDGKIFAIGGFGAKGFTATVEEYDIESGKWTTAPGLPSPRSDLAVAVVKDTIYVLGGCNSTGYLAAIDQFDPRKAIWRTVRTTSLSRARASLGAVGYADTLYAVGGEDESGFLNDVDRFKVTSDGLLEKVRHSPIA